MNTLNTFDLELETLEALLGSLEADAQNAYDIAEAHMRVVDIVNEGAMSGMT